jgi:hypothetical protein
VTSLSDEMFQVATARAPSTCYPQAPARLVVDTGPHAFGRSRQRAADHLRDNTDRPEPGSGPVPLSALGDLVTTWAGRP